MVLEEVSPATTLPQRESPADVEPKKASAAKDGKRKKSVEGGDRSGSGESEELPKSVIRRIVKTRLQALADASAEANKDAPVDGPGTSKKEVQISKDALLAFSESSRVFIHFLTATANDFCRQRKRSTVTAEDVLAAAAEIHFPEFVPPLQKTLEELRASKKAKKDSASKSARKEAEGAGDGADRGPSTPAINS